MSKHSKNPDPDFPSKSGKLPPQSALEAVDRAADRYKSPSKWFNASSDNPAKNDD